jgi:hypothetical protein
MMDDTGPAASRPSQYVVRISVPDRAAASSLARRGVGVTSVSAAVGGGFEVRGVMTLAEIGVLVDEGIAVFVRRNARATSEPVTVGVEEWYAAVLEDLEIDRTVG